MSRVMDTGSAWLTLSLWYVVACHAESGPLCPDDVNGIRTPGPSSPSGSVAASL